MQAIRALPCQKCLVLARSGPPRRANWVATAARAQADSAPSSCKHDVRSLTLSLYLTTASLVLSGTAWADAELTYNPRSGEEFITNVTGALYVGLVAVFLYRLLTRRAKKAREERVAGGGSPLLEVPAIKPQATGGKTTSLAAFLGAVQAGLLAAGLWLFTTKVQGVMYNQQLPTGYAAHNIAVTVRTIIVGCCYLFTFFFSANTAGLAGLSLQLLLFPDSLKDEEEEEEMAAQGPQLPKVSVTSSTDDIRKAFEIAQRVGQKEASGGTGDS